MKLSRFRKSNSLIGKQPQNIPEGSVIQEGKPPRTAIIEQLRVVSRGKG